MEYYSAMEKNKLLMHLITWLNLQSIMLSEGCKAQRLHTVEFYLYKILDAVKLKLWKVNQWI